MYVITSLMNLQQITRNPAGISLGNSIECWIVCCNTFCVFSTYFDKIWLELIYFESIDLIFIFGIITVFIGGRKDLSITILEVFCFYFCTCISTACSFAGIQISNAPKKFHEANLFTNLVWFANYSNCCKSIALVVYLVVTAFTVRASITRAILLVSRLSELSGFYCFRFGILKLVSL